MGRAVRQFEKEASLRLETSPLCQETLRSLTQRMKVRRLLKKPRQDPPLYSLNTEMVLSRKGIKLLIYQYPIVKSPTARQISG